MKNCPSRHMVVAATQTDGNKKKGEPTIRVMQFLGAVVATKVVPQWDPESNKL